MPLTLKAYQLEAEAIELIRKWASVNGSQGRAILEGMRALERCAASQPATEKRDGPAGLTRAEFVSRYCREG